MSNSIGQYIRLKREKLNELDKRFSLRKVAERCGVEPSYLSKIERDIEKHPSEQLLINIAKEINCNQDTLLAMNGKISTELKDIILNNPELFSELLQALKNSNPNSILRIVKEVRDGKW